MQRITEQRRVLLEELQATKRHPTADELYETVRCRLPNISLGTVYRNLDLLVRSGSIRKLDKAGGQARYDADLSEHLHVRCLHCGAIADLPDDGALKLEIPLPVIPSYAITRYRLEFEGTCPGCSAGTT
ncbi:MAG: transcriptional repressor [Candidatus Hydrogenedentes bacterium]|nr:transcriptional repressor [Candidatus Hydrogenedentota bacterium]